MTDKSEDTNLSELAQEYEVRISPFSLDGVVSSQIPDHREDAPHFILIILFDKSAKYRSFDSERVDRG